MTKSDSIISDPVLAARGRLGAACRISGDPTEIAAARDALKIAKAERLRRDADALLAEVVDRSRVLVLGYNDGDAPPRGLHAELEQQQHAECRDFLAANPPGSWSDEQQSAWTAVLRKHTDAHAALGCGRTANCRMARG